MDWTNRSVLVTGAGGFIGSHLTERLVALGARTRALVHYNSLGRWGWLDESPSRGEVEVVAGDITDRESLRRVMDGVEFVFHLAALIGIPYSYLAPASYVRTNVEGTLNVLQVALDAGVGKVIHTSTSEVYGTARYVPIDEDHPLQGQSPYSASKIGADKQVEAFNRSFGQQVVTVRPFNTYGPRQSARAIIPTIVTQCLSGSTVRLGNLSPTRDLVFVEDTVRGFLLAADSPGAVGRVVNLGTGTEISIGALAQKIAGIMGKEVTIEADDQRKRPSESEIERLVASNALAKELLGWEPEYTLDDGLPRTIEWLQANRGVYRPDAYAL